MLKDLNTNYKLNGLKKDAVLNLLGEPNRTDSGYLFYTILQPYILNTMPLSNKSLVIKFTKHGTVEWRKIHE